MEKKPKQSKKVEKNDKQVEIFLEKLNKKWQKVEKNEKKLQKRRKIAENKSKKLHHLR